MPQWISVEMVTTDFSSMAIPPLSWGTEVPGLPIAVAIDIKPESCPNPLNCKAKGRLPVAILGTPERDVVEIDPASIRLEGVAPLRSSLEDVAAPFDPLTAKEDCFNDCTSEGPDGFLDLTLKLDTQAILDAIGPVEDGECWALQLTGHLKEEFGGALIVGEDLVRILCRKLE